MTNKIQPRKRIISNICLLHHAPLQTPTLHNPTRHRPLNPVLPTLDRNIRQTNLIRVPRHDRRHAEVGGFDFVVGDVQFEVAAVVEVVPVEFRVGGFEPVGVFVGGGEGDVLAVGAGGGDGGAGEFDA